MPLLLLDCGAAAIEAAGLPSKKKLRSVLRDEKAEKHFTRLVNEISSSEDYYRSAAIGHILLLFSELYRHHCVDDDSDAERISARSYACLTKSLEYIQLHLLEKPDILSISRHVNMSKSYFCHLFRQYMDMPPLRYINMLKCDYARRLMAEKGMNVTEAAHTVGVDNLSYFIKMYKKHLGATPSADALNKDARDRRGSVIGIR